MSQRGKSEYGGEGDGEGYGDVGEGWQRRGLFGEEEEVGGGGEGGEGGLGELEKERSMERGGERLLSNSPNKKHGVDAGGAYRETESRIHDDGCLIWV